MSSSAMNLVLTLTGRDDGANKLLQETERQLQKSKSSREQLARSNHAYALVGVRSEHAIRREIDQTQAAYNRLARSGKASQNDLARAAVATKNRIHELNAELNQGIQAQSRWRTGLGKIGKFGAAVAAGGMAAYSTLKPAMDNQKQLQSNMHQVARNAWIADDDKSPEWIATEGVKQVRDLAASWVKQSGGTADAAIGFMNAQMAQGMSFEEIQSDKGRGYAGMTAMSQNGQYDFDGAASLYSVFKNAGLKGDKLTRAVEKTIQSGLDGKFEIADVVREAPALLASMGKAGMTADKDFDYMLAWMQSSANKASNNGEAANNIKNTLAKASSSDLQVKLKKAIGANWKAEVLKGQGRGENSVQVLARLLNTRLSKDKEYQKYKQAADKGDAKAAIQASTIRAMLVSKVMPDLQAQSGLMAAMDTEQMQRYQKSTQGTGDNKIDRINQARMLDMGAQQERNQSLALLQQDKLTNPLNQAETRFTALTAEFPNATLALQALAAAATAAAIAQGAMGLLGRGGGGAAAGTAGTAGTAGRAALAGAARLGVAGVAVAAGGYGLMDANERINRNEGKDTWEGGLDSRGAGYLESIGSGAAVGAAIGTIVPVIGTAVGAAVGGVVGGIAAYISDDSDAKKAPQKTNPTPIPMQASSTPQISMMAAPVPNPALATKAEPPEKLTPVITQQTATYQTALAAQTSNFQAALQADTAAVGGKLDAINGTLGGLNQNIQLTTAVHLDGRVIANEVSRHAIAIFGRGAAQ